MPDAFAGSQHFALIKTFFNLARYFFSFTSGRYWGDSWPTDATKGKKADYFWQLHPPKLARPFFPWKSELVDVMNEFALNWIII